ncbi:flocculation protein FLO11-like [Mangifera indica]|uniref:flocculation protein FLO11-like n=1 Tax=Mangifera indica TaxID=29780 RepID=UPI001CFC0B1A|nr:flocculation protein FLO11-like [Mangifera indica]
MASISRPRRLMEPLSGGKMVRPRRSAANKTPYDRPALSPNPTPQNPNWLSKFICSPTRLIATGAGKLLSSVFAGDSSSSCSSSSENESDDSDNEMSSQTTDSIKKKRALEVTQQPSEPQIIPEKSETKHLIERLIMQVTYSREEFNRLTSIIKSRVVDSPIFGDAADGRLSELSNRIAGNDVDMPDLCSAAVSEAKKWLEEKKLGSNSKSDLELGTCTLNSVMLPHDSGGEAGSPADVAKSYMQTRPPWTSPSGNHTEYQLLSPTRIQLFKDKTPYSISFPSLSSKLKIDNPASGSWNISEELRKVRSRATEEMLRTLPSSKIDLSALTSENRSVIKSIVADEVEATTRDEVLNSTKAVDASLNLVTGVNTSYGLPVSQVAQDRLQSELLTPHQASFISEQKKPHMKDLEDVKTMEETRDRRPSSEQRLQPSEEFKTVLQSDAEAANVDGVEINGTIQLYEPEVSGTAQDTTLHDQNCSALKKIAGKDGLFTPNGCPPSGSCLDAGQDREQSSQPSDAKQNPVGSSHNKVSPICEFLTEASVEVPITCEIDSPNTGSQNSSSMPSEELSLDMTRSSKRSVAGKTSGATEKRPGKKLTGYNRRRRARGKQ